MQSIAKRGSALRTRWQHPLLLIAIRVNFHLVGAVTECREQGTNINSLDSGSIYPEYHT